jgi:DNA excision repair protein ERCC-4
MSLDPSTQEQERSMVPTGMLPVYLADAFACLYEQDGLCVLGKGLGGLMLLGTFIRFYADADEGHAAVLRDEDAHGNNTEGSVQNHKNPTRPPCVLVLGLNDNERSALINILLNWGTPPDMLPTMITNESGQSKDREPMYKRGGVLCITSRILIVDLLTQTADSKDIDGILIWRAELVTDKSTEAFILRIYKSQKQLKGFVKAFSQEPAQLNMGFSQIDKIRKALYVRGLYLYPRFHDAIRQELESHPPHVTEMHQSLTPLQQEMQAAIVAAVQSCIRELKSQTSKIDWSKDPDLAIENCVTSRFDQTITNALQPDWHTLTPGCKQLIQDLRTLRTLFQSLIHFDCISFWMLLQNLKTASAKTRHPSMWLLTPAADMLFRKAKERVYQIHKPKATKKVPNPLSKLVCITADP